MIGLRRRAAGCSPHGKRVLITGASRGIGRALARHAGSVADELLLVARDAAALEELAAELPCWTRVLPCDLVDPRARSDLLAELAPDPIDILVNNAAIGSRARFHETHREDIERVITLDLWVPVELTRALLPGMLERGVGGILNVGSTVGARGIPFLASYSASKAFLAHFSEALAYELTGTGVTVTAILPGTTRTDFFGARGMPPGLAWMAQTPEQVARESWRAFERGTPLRISGWRNRVLLRLQSCVPRSIAARVAYGLFRPSTGSG